MKHRDADFGASLTDDEMALIALIEKTYVVTGVTMGDTLGDLGHGMIYAADHARMREAFRNTYNVELSESECYRKTFVWQLWHIVEGLHQ